MSDDWIICRDCAEAWLWDEREERSCECDEDHGFRVTPFEAAEAREQELRHTLKTIAEHRVGTECEDPEGDALLMKEIARSALSNKDEG
jgi:hypothetical protein